MRPKTLGKALKAYRYERNLTQLAMAKKVGTSQTIISQIERGVVPSGRILYQIKKFLEMTK